MGGGVTDFLDLMPATVTVAPTTGVDGYGTPSYGAPVSYRARVVYKQELVRTPSGDEITARGHVWLVTAVRIPDVNRITLPDATTPQILVSENYPDQSGAHHSKVYFL